MNSAIIGFTPQIKISDRISFFADFSLIANAGMETTWDGKSPGPNSGFDGSLYSYTAGFNIALGKNKEHADWYVQENELLSEIEMLEERLTKIETDLIDTDQDGVPDYLDRENNTVSGVSVNSKGVAVDTNKNGIPDEIESSLDARFLNKDDYKPGTTTVTSDNNKNLIKDLITNGYVNVYFKTNSSNPETYSLEAINYLKTYLNENPGTTAQLIGYADQIGNASYNTQLSQRRAKKVYDILVASGIASNRLSHKGNGEDASAGINSAQARQLVRRVTFKLN
jgi:OOP family OmpA-OmpF porin